MHHAYFSLLFEAAVKGKMAISCIQNLSPVYTFSPQMPGFHGTTQTRVGGTGLHGPVCLSGKRQI